MGLFDKIFRPQQAKQAQALSTYWRTLNAYTPAFASRQGSLYEMELTRSAVHAFATHASKLKPEVVGPGNRALKKVLPYRANSMMSTSQFLYRLATILAVETTAYVVPETDSEGNGVYGYWPILPSRTEIKEGPGGEPWLVYTFSDGQRGAIEAYRCAVLTMFQYLDDFFGTGNAALSPTLDLLDIQRQGMEDAVKSAANIRFIGRINGQVRPEDIKQKRDAFAAENLAAENTTGLVLYDNTFADLKQIEASPWLIDDKQMALIKENVFGYFGVNDAILRNEFDEQVWDAFYEGKVEPFALQLSLGLTNMTFSPSQLARGNAVAFSSNRLQYASTKNKLEVASQMFDRGVLTTNQIMDIWNLPGIGAEGDKRFIRREYIDATKLDEQGSTQQGVTVQVNGPAGDGAAVENLQATALNGAQIASLVQVVQAMNDGLLEAGQAASIVAVALAIEPDQAKQIVNGGA